MQKVLTIIIALLIAYTIFSEKAAKFSLLKKEKDNFIPLTAENIPNKSQNSNLDTIQAKPNNLATNSSLKPQGYVERILSNSMFNYLQTEDGQKLAEKLTNNRHPIINKPNNIHNILRRHYTVKTVKPGTGAFAICGQEVEVEYKLINQEKKIIKDSLEKFIIGLHQSAEMNAIILGMKKEEIVNVDFSTANFLTTQALKNQKLSFFLKLKDIITPYHFDPRKIKIFDDYSPSEYVVSCNDLVKIDLSIFKINGDSLAERSFIFTVGDHNYPEILSYIINNKPVTNKRTILMPGEYLAKHKNSFINYDIIKDEYVIVEIDKTSLLPKNETISS